jgi:hypothetical protein
MYSSASLSEGNAEGLDEQQGEAQEASLCEDVMREDYNLQGSTVKKRCMRQDHELLRLYCMKM